MKKIQIPKWPIFLITIVFIMSFSLISTINYQVLLFMWNPGTFKYCDGKRKKIHYPKSVNYDKQPLALAVY